MPTPKQLSISQVLSAGLLSSFESPNSLKALANDTYDILFAITPDSGRATLCRKLLVALTPRSCTKFAGKKWKIWQSKSPSLSNNFECLMCKGLKQFISIHSQEVTGMELTLPREVLVSILSADPKAWCSLRKNSSIAPWKDLVISSDTTCLCPLWWSNALQDWKTCISWSHCHQVAGPANTKTLAKQLLRKSANYCSQSVQV